MNNKVTFKPYDMNQLKLPIELGIEIPEKHLVKIVVGCGFNRTNKYLVRQNDAPYS